MVKWVSRTDSATASATHTEEALFRSTRHYTLIIVTAHKINYVKGAVRKNYKKNGLENETSTGPGVLLVNTLCKVV